MTLWAHCATAQSILALTDVTDGKSRYVVQIHKAVPLHVQLTQVEVFCPGEHAAKASGTYHSYAPAAGPVSSPHLDCALRVPCCMQPSTVKQQSPDYSAADYAQLTKGAQQAVVKCTT